MKNKKQSEIDRTDPNYCVWANCYCAFREKRRDLEGCLAATTKILNKFPHIITVIATKETWVNGKLTKTEQIPTKTCDPIEAIVWLERLCVAVAGKPETKEK